MTTEQTLIDAVGKVPGAVNTEVRTLAAALTIGDDYIRDALKEIAKISPDFEGPASRLLDQQDSAAPRMAEPKAELRAAPVIPFRKDLPRNFAAPKYEGPNG